MACDVLIASILPFRALLRVDSASACTWRAPPGTIVLRGSSVGSSWTFHRFIWRIRCVAAGSLILSPLAPFALRRVWPSSRFPSACFVFPRTRSWLFSVPSLSLFFVGIFYVVFPGFFPFGIPKLQRDATLVDLEKC